MNVREEAASFSTSSEDAGAVTRCWKEFANCSLGGCWWQPWLKPAVLKMNHSANPTVTRLQLWNRILSLLRGTLAHAFRADDHVMIHIVAPPSETPRWCLQLAAMLLRLNSPVCFNPPVYQPMGLTRKMKVLFAVACVRSCSQTECQAAESATAAQLKK